MVWRKFHVTRVPRDKRKVPYDESSGNLSNLPIYGNIESLKEPFKFDSHKKKLTGSHDW